jgi:hypothetical protein
MRTAAAFGGRYLVDAATVKKDPAASLLDS